MLYEAGSSIVLLPGTHLKEGTTVVLKITPNLQVEDNNSPGEGTHIGLRLTEHHIYGSSRLGIQKAQESNEDDNTYYNTIGDKRYELSSHLGNVVSVISDRKLAVYDATSTTFIKFTPDVLSFSDYMPGGMQMPNRNSQGNYRYAYQGQEKDPETGKEAFQLRLYDSRINRWLSPDPKGQYHSPYMAMGNNYVNGVDPDGGAFHILAGVIIGGLAAGVSLALEPGDIDWLSGRTWGKIGLGAATGASIAALPLSAAGALGVVTTRLIGSSIASGAIATSSDVLDQAIDVHYKGGSIAKLSQYNYSKALGKGALTTATFGLGGYVTQKLSYQATLQNWSGSINNSMTNNIFYRAPNIGAASVNASLDIFNFNSLWLFNSFGNTPSDNKVINLPELIIKGSLSGSQNQINNHIEDNR